MTEAATPALDQKMLAYLQIWTDSFSQVLAQITGAPAPCRIGRDAPAEAAAAGAAGDASRNAAEDGGAQWILVTSGGGLRGEMSVRLSPASVLRLGQAFMSEPAVADLPLTPDHRDSVIELLRQVSGIVAGAAKPHWGELQLHVEGIAAAPSWAPAESFWLQAGAGTPSGMALEFGLSAALVAELRAEKIEAGKSEPADPVAGSSPSPVIPAADLQPSALDRLMDVQLAVTMRFGSRRLLLREVLELSPGAVVELDRRLQEPVDLLLDGRLIARGDVVVIDGNYGIRVSDVTPQAAQIGRHDG